MKRPGWFSRLWSRTLGFRVLERTETTVLLRTPWWATDEMKDRALAKVYADAELAWPGAWLVASRGDRLLRLSRVPRQTTHLIAVMPDDVLRTVCGRRADGLPVAPAADVTCAECWQIARAIEAARPLPSIAGFPTQVAATMPAAMIHVTAQLTQLHDSATTRETKRVVNRGANPVDVSTDPALTFGSGLTVAAAGGEDTVELQPGERLFGRCGAGLATDVAVV